jgi:ribosome-binding factor A
MPNEVRARKLADRIKVIAAETLERRVKDPRLGFVTITEARVTGDLREATVFYTVYGDEESRTSSAAALDNVRGLIRSEVGRQTGIKFTPTVTFVADAVPDTARHIEDLLSRAQAADEAVAAAARGASYAGDPDPYRPEAGDASDADDEADDDADRAGDDGDTEGRDR